jgi:hypothetical protein
MLRAFSLHTAGCLRGMLPSSHSMLLAGRGESFYNAILFFRALYYIMYAHERDCGDVLRHTSWPRLLRSEGKGQAARQIRKLPPDSRREATTTQTQNSGLLPVIVSCETDGWCVTGGQITSRHPHEASSAISRPMRAHPPGASRPSSPAPCWPWSSRPRSSRYRPHDGDRTSS